MRFRRSLRGIGASFLVIVAARDAGLQRWCHKAGSSIYLLLEDAMIRGERLTAIVPARAGSKGIIGKNLYRFKGETLLDRAIRFAQKSRRIDDVYVTTDDPEMFRIAAGYGADLAIRRPADLASDTARTIDAVIHLIETVSLADGYAVLLQVTSPLRTLADCEQLCERFEACSDADAVASVVRQGDPHPNKMLCIDGGYLRSYLGTDPSVPRQTLPEVYAFNGAFYLTAIDTILHERAFIPPRTIPYEMPAERSINLDSKLDLVLLEAVVEKGIVEPECYLDS